MVAVAAVAAGFLGASAAPAQARPTIYVLPANGIFVTRGAGAIGLYVPGTGGSVNWSRAIAALRRGTVENDFGRPHGKILVDLAFGVPVQPLRARPHAARRQPAPGSSAPR